MKTLYILILLLMGGVARGQQFTITGKIVNSETRQPLPAASIFINNTSRGTTSNADGEFRLTNISVNTFTLIVTYTGFTTRAIQVTGKNILQPLNILMNPNIERLDDITIMIPDKDGWKKWGHIFSDNFLGTSEFAQKCTIENPGDINFYFDRKLNILHAFSDKDIIIRNNALGYLIKYQIQKFIFDYNKKMVAYSGFAFFSDLKSKNLKKTERWHAAREMSYKGSLMYFIRALYRDSVSEYGFDVREKIRINKNDTLFNKLYKPGHYPQVVSGNNTYNVYPEPLRQSQKQPEYLDLVNTTPFSFKKIITADPASKHKSFYFDNMLQVTYKDAFVTPGYLASIRYSVNTKLNQVSDVTLLSDAPLTIQSDGTYFDPLNMETSGYWGWAHLGEMLPSDYQSRQK